MHQLCIIIHCLYPVLFRYSSRGIVGRHGIRIQSWSHPNSTETMKAHRIIETVQREQSNSLFWRITHSPEFTRAEAIADEESLLT
ncbi:hypothetical protein PS2_000903 [Malus domestica]